MSRAFALTVAVALSIAPRVARAQQPFAPAVAAPAVAAPAAVAPAPINPADGECTTTTTTTTRCTGAAAPYAAHPAPPMVVVPAPAPPSLVPCPIVLPHGWNLQQDPDGTWWRTRKHRGVAAYWAPGLTLWMLSYAGGMMGGVGSGSPEATFPIAGAFVSAAFSQSGQAVALWAIDGVAQLGGLILFIAGASLDGQLERLPVTITPTSFYGGGNGVALAGHF